MHKTLKKIAKSLSLFLFLISFFLMITGCSSREKKPVVNADSTIVFPAKNINDISASITLCRRISKSTGEKIGEGTVFSIMENSNLRSYIDFENLTFPDNRALMFHIDWVSVASGKSVYQKRIDLSPNDSLQTINSSISISPETREAGKYILRLFYFRELIAEKHFELLPEFQLVNTNGESILANITLCRKVSKKTGKRIGVDSVFTVKKRRNLRAYVDFQNRFVYGNRELLFRFEWVDSTGQSFYRKQYDLSPSDTISTIRSSISIAPDKRDIGEYSVRLLLFNKIIAEEKFVLQAKPKTIKPKVNVFLFSKINKQTGEYIGKGNIFTLGKKNKVRAKVDIQNREKLGKKDLHFRVEWIGIDGKSFYKKDITLASSDSKSAISSSISINEKKRLPGNYTFKIYLFDNLIASEKFRLQK